MLPASTPWLIPLTNLINQVCVCKVWVTPYIQTFLRSDFHLFGSEKTKTSFDYSMCKKCKFNFDKGLNKFLLTRIKIGVFGNEALGGAIMKVARC